MGRFHRATISPTKADLVAAWAPTRLWGPPATEPVEVVHIAPSDVRILGGGWSSQERVAVDGFELRSDAADASVLHNDRFELRMFRRPVPGPRPAIGLTASSESLPDAVVL